MKEIMTKISATTLILIHLFSCGTIYLVAYWSTFNFDITNYIEFLDIPKSFVFPLASGIGISFIITIFQGVIRSLDKLEKDVMVNAELLPQIKKLRTHTLLYRIIIDYDVWTIVALSVCYFYYEPHREWVYYISGIILIIYGVVKFTRHSTVINSFPHFGIRLFMAVLICFIPITSFTTGKLNAIKIFNNTRYFKVTNVKYSEPMASGNSIVNYKLLGKLGNSLFISDSLNVKIRVVNLEKVDLVEYELVTRAESN